MCAQCLLDASEPVANGLAVRLCMFLTSVMNSEVFMNRLPVRPRETIAGAIPIVAVMKLNHFLLGCVRKSRRMQPLQEFLEHGES